MWNLGGTKSAFFEKTFAQRACPNFYNIGIKLHRMTVILFLTDLKKISSLESYDFSKSGNACFRELLRVQFLLGIQYKPESEEAFPIGFPIETGLMTGHRIRHSTTLKSHNFLMRK